MKDPFRADVLRATLPHLNLVYYSYGTPRKHSNARRACVFSSFVVGGRARPGLGGWFISPRLPTPDQVASGSAA